MRSHKNSRTKKKKKKGGPIEKTQELMEDSVITSLFVFRPSSSATPVSHRHTLLCVLSSCRTGATCVKPDQVAKHLGLDPDQDELLSAECFDRKRSKMLTPALAGNLKC